MATISSDIRSVGIALSLLSSHVHPEQRPLVRLARQNLASLAVQVEGLENLCACLAPHACPMDPPPGLAPAQAGAVAPCPLYRAAVGALAAAPDQNPARRVRESLPGEGLPALQGAPFSPENAHDRLQ